MRTPQSEQNVLGMFLALGKKVSMCPEGQREYTCKEIYTKCSWYIFSTFSIQAKNLPAMQETCIQSLGQEDPWRRKWQPTPVFLPGKSDGQGSLVGYSS